MKKFIVFAAFLIAISSTAGAQTKPQKQPRKSSEEKMREKKEAEEQLKALEEEEAEKKSSRTKTPARTTKKAPARDTEDMTGPRSAVVTTYYNLPLESIPQVKNYIEEKEDVDSKSLRRGFIRNHVAGRNYLHLQLPADDRLTRIQQFETEDRKNIVAIETNNCQQGTCNNTFEFYTKDGDEWTNVTEKYMPELDKKYILSKIKSKYKKDYSDLDIYNSKGYETDEDFYKKAIISVIDVDQNKIIIKEQYLSLPLYEMVWDGKSKFVLKKL